MLNKSSWHQEREGYRKTLQRILDTNGDNWQAVVSAFEKINKPSRTAFGLMVKYYGRRGDMHRARETFERIRETLRIHGEPLRTKLFSTRLCLQTIGYMKDLTRLEKERGIPPSSEFDAFMKAASVSGRGVLRGQRKRLTTGDITVGPRKMLFMNEISTGT